MANEKRSHEEKPPLIKKPVPTDYSAFAQLLPSYDGNKRTLAFYIEGVEIALALITNKEDACVTCLIRNKLKGKAVEALSESPGAKTWAEIKTILQRKFGEFRTEIQLVQELMNVTRDTGSLEAFGDKIRILMSTLISIEPNKRVYYEQMALETFLDKLNPITAILIKLKHVENLEQAITVAKQEEIKLRNRRSDLNKSNHTIKPSATNNKQTRTNTFNKRDQFQKSKPYAENPDVTKRKIHFQNEVGPDDENQPEIEQDTDENSSEENYDENFLLDLENQFTI